MSEDRIEEMRRRVLDVHRLAEAASAEAVSEGGEVRVVTGAAGALKEVDLRLNAFQLSGVELGELLVETIRAADAKLGAELRAAIQERLATVGDLTAEEDGR